MGGNAFPDLQIPRLPPELYYKLVAEYQLRLKRIFGSVACPISGPAKTSHGDIDFLVTYPDPEHGKTRADSLTLKTESAVTIKKGGLLELSEQNPYVLEVQKAFRYQRAVPSGPTTSFAVPHPDPSLERSFVQLDLHLCDSVGHLDWLHFHHSHGDLWNLFGTSLRPFGFTASDTGFYVRDPVIENLDRKRGRIFLTNDTRRVLKFLGVSEEKYFGEDLCKPRHCDALQNGDYSHEDIVSEGESQIEHIPAEASNADPFDRELATELQIVAENLERRKRGERAFMEFESEEDLFEYAITSRFFRKKWYVKYTLNANDRQRLHKRHLFRKFATEFVHTLPNGIEEQCNKDWLNEKRDFFREEALNEFGKKKEFEVSREAWDKEREALRAKQILRSLKEAESYCIISYSDGWIGSLGGEWTDYLKKEGMPKLPAGWDRGWIEGREDVGWE